MTASAEQLRADQFQPTDTCDRCGAPAQARVEVPGGDLLFCLRHFRLHRGALEPVVLVPPIFAF